MEDIRRILAVSRMTTYCRKVVHYGISLSKKYNALLYVIHVVHNPPGLEGWNLPPLEQDFAILFKESKDDIDAAIKAERATGMDIREVIREGEPTQVILDVAEEEKIDLVIMLAHEQGRLEHFLFGHSNEEIIRRLPCSILLVKKEPAVFGAEY
jgi:nucleotide-binding universal stress UspA family protein